MNKLLILVAIFILPVHAYSDTETKKGICYKVDNCKVGDVIILEFNTLTKPGVTTRVARLCDFDKTIYTYETHQKQPKVACVYAGERRVLRKKQEEELHKP
jgi:hypothetical protein